jgi:putative membrane protein
MQTTMSRSHQPAAPNPWLTKGPEFAKAALIGGTGAMLLVKVFTNTLPLYVHVRYTPMITITGIILLVMAGVQVWMTLRSEAHDHDHHDHDDGHDHAPITWKSPALLALLVPVILGLLVPPRALGSAAINTQGFSNTGTGMRTVQTIVDSTSVVDTSQWTLLDYVNALVYKPDHPQLQGQPIETSGFVWRNADMPEGQFYIARFVVSCCSADGLAIYLPVQWEGSNDLPNDSWVRVQGTIGLEEVQGQPAAVIQAAEIIPIEQPAQPYLYP